MLEQYCCHSPVVTSFCKRYRISDRTGAAVAIATLKVFEIVTESESKFVIDRSKLRKERSKCREKIQTERRPLIRFLNSKILLMVQNINIALKKAA